MKYKVLERGTGQKNPNEWIFLREDWKFHLQGDVHFDQHFAFLIFDRSDNSNEDLGDRLILNLLTRKQFWMARRETADRISEKAAGILGLGQFRIEFGASLRCYDMYVGKYGIIIKYLVDFAIYNLNEVYGIIRSDDDVPTLGWFSNRFKVVYRIVYTVTCQPIPPRGLPYSF